MIPAAIYARFSTDKQDTRSIEDQIRQCRAYAERMGYEIVAVYSDAAVSGTHTNREGLRKLRDMATGKRCPFRVVIVEDLSRLSRDIGDTHTIVFRDLAGAGIKVVDTSGLDSEADSGEMQIAMKSIISREYVRAVSKMTHRGMTGRALAGFSTGGSLYGYRTITEPNPSDPERPRKAWQIHEPEAMIVRRIFAEYDGGATGYKGIAERLNTEGIPAPRDGKRGHKVGHGWNHTSVRAILTNPKYAGEWVWNTHKYQRTGGKLKRRARPEAEHITREMPELAIIDRVLFDRVQKRLVRVQRTEGSGGRPAGGPKPYLVSGLLRCGTCGGPMSIHGQKIKNGIRYANFACSANRSRGASVCPNGASISEKKITEALLGALRDLATDSTLVDAYVRGFERRLVKGKAKPQTGDTERLLREAEGRVANVTKALARMPDSEALYSQLATEEATVKRLRAEVTKARPAGAPRVAPDRAKVRAGIAATLNDITTGKPERAREILARVITSLTLARKNTTPGTWMVTGAVRLRTLVAVSANFSSGGRI